MTTLASWSDIREKFLLVNPELGNIIDQLSPSPSYQFLDCYYPFGALILNKERISFPKDIEPKTLLKHFSYNSIPLGIVIDKLVEVFVEATPLNIISKGDLFGVFETIDYMNDINNSPIWSITSGSRNIFTLPKIANAISIKRLKSHFNITDPTETRNINEHWNLFRNITSTSNNTWRCNISYFSNRWLQQKKDPSWRAFYDYIYKKNWEQSQYAINKIKFSLIWQEFMTTISDKHFKPRPYLSDTIKHIFSIAAGHAPGISPCNNEDFAPIQSIQDALLNIYKIKTYHPTIMCANNLTNDNNNYQTYYSLSYPTLLEGSAVDTYSSTIMFDLKDIKHLINVYKKTCSHSHNEIISNTKFDYFHVDKDKHGEILPSHLIAEKDDQLRLAEQKEAGVFCHSSMFWKGCVKISKQATCTQKNSLS